MRDVEAELPDAIRTGEQIYFDLQSRQVRARRATRLGAIVFDETPLPRPTGEAVAKALADGVRQLGLGCPALFEGRDPAARAASAFCIERSASPGRMSAMPHCWNGWTTGSRPTRRDARGLSDISAGSLSSGLMSLVPHELQRDLSRLAPTHFEAPTGQRHPIQYDGEEPLLTIRVQELFGLKQHPAIGGGRLPLLLELTSPAHRPIQTTRDLPGFWAGSWKDVRAEMRGRYPRHPWPERPEEALPTTRAKPRGT